MILASFPVHNNGRLVRKIEAGKRKLRVKYVRSTVYTDSSESVMHQERTHAAPGNDGGVGIAGAVVAFSRCGGVEKGRNLREELRGARNILT